MSFVALAAFPATLVVLAALLRSPLAARLVAQPSDDRFHKDPTPIFGGIGIFAGLSAGLWLAVAAGAFHPGKELLGVYGGVALLFVAGLVDDVRHLSPVAKLAAQLAAGGIVLATGTTVQLVDNPLLAGGIAMLWLVGLTNAFNLLDNMDGLAATLAGIAFAFFAIDASTVHPSHAVLAFSLAGCLACAGFLPFNLRPGKALLFMGDSGSQLLGFSLAALGLSSSWKVAGTTVATLILPVLVLAVPILDTTLVTVVRLLEGRPISQGGLDHSSHRLVRLGLPEKHAVALLALVATGLGTTSLAYNVLDDQRLTLAGVLITFVLLVQFASFLADAERRGPLAGEAPGLLQTFAVHWRRLVEVVVDFGLISLAFVAAYAIQFGWPGSVNQRHLAATVTLPVLLVTRYLAFIPFGLYRSIWRYAGTRDLLSIVSAVVVSELVTVGYISATQALSDFSRVVFIVDALLCIVLIGASRMVERAVVTGMESVRDRAGRRTLIVGAGVTGRSLMQELRETPGERVVGFVDDNPQVRRRRVRGVAILGTIAELPRILERTKPDIVLVTIPNAQRDRLDLVVDACAEAGVVCNFVRREIDLDPRVVLGSTAE